MLFKKVKGKGRDLLQSCFMPGTPTRAGLAWEHRCVYPTEKSWGVHVLGPHTEMHMFFLLHLADLTCALKGSHMVVEIPHSSFCTTQAPIISTSLALFFSTHRERMPSELSCHQIGFLWCIYLGCSHSLAEVLLLLGFPCLIPFPVSWTSQTPPSVQCRSLPHS